MYEGEDWMGDLGGMWEDGADWAEEEEGEGLVDIGEFWVAACGS